MTATMLEQLQRRLPDVHPDADSIALLSDLLEEAEAWILAYTRRTTMPDDLSSIAVRLATISYNRLGVEGESNHSEGAVTRTIETLPADIREALMSHRIARTVH